MRRYVAQQTLGLMNVSLAVPNITVAVVPVNWFSSLIIAFYFQRIAQVFGHDASIGMKHLGKAQYEFFSSLGFHLEAREAVGRERPHADGEHRGGDRDDQRVGPE